MCGYIGSLSKNKINLDILNKANEKIICRGPDSKKIYTDAFSNFNLAGVFNRLSIIELNNLADQPMVSNDGNHVLFFNGEIYNNIELRNFLESKGYNFKTKHSDTETLLNTLIHFQDETPTKLRGQFSFVYLNKIENKLFLCRDRLGQKPLYYFNDSSRISFSSNLISLKDITNQNQLNESSLFSYLNYGKTEGISTIFQNLYQVDQGEMIVVELQDSFKVTKKNYWNLLNYYDDQSFNEEEFFELFSESVKLRTNSDVPFATFLSGGLDSTSIVKSQIDQNLEVNTFSVYMGNASYDESYYCETASNFYNTNHKSIRIDSTLTIATIEDIVNVLDEPFSDPSIVPTSLLSKEISNYYKMAISGDGGDELLGGYLRVQKSVYPKATTNFADILFSLYPSAFGTGNIFLSKHKNFNDRYNSFLSDSHLLKLLNLKSKNIKINQFEINEGLDTYKQAMYNEYTYFLPQLMMYKVDRASMANSLEVRSPFLDNKVIEYIYSHSHEYFDITNSKNLLRNYLTDDLGRKFVNRKKQGFTFDLENFIFSKSNYFKENIYLLDNHLDIDLKNLKTIFNFKTKTNALRIWKLYVLSNYLTKNL